MTTTISIGEAARRLGVSVDTVRRWTDEGRLISIRTLGGHRRYDPAQLDQLKGAES